MPFSIQQLAERIGAKVVGDGAVTLTSCAPIETAGPGDVTFISNKKYLDALETTKASAVIIDSKTPCPDHITKLIADDPYFAFRNALIELHGFRTHPSPMEATKQQSDQATAGSDQTDDAENGKPSSLRRSVAASLIPAIHPTATIGSNTAIHPNVVIERHARIGSNCVLYPGVYIGEHATVGDDCVLYPNVVIYDRCIVGNRVNLHSCTVIGQDGFGYATHKGAHHKIPQTGIVVIEDDVEMGAGCAIERAAMGETRIGKGTKFADLISIGHGTTVGSHCLFVSLVGVSGSVDVGKYVVLGGQVGVAGHLRIGDFVQAAARTAIVQDVPDGLKVAGVPAIELDKAKRNALAGLELYDLFKRVRQLERQIESLKNPT